MTSLEAVHCMCMNEIINMWIHAIQDELMLKIQHLVKRFHFTGVYICTENKILKKRQKMIEFTICSSTFSSLIVFQNTAFLSFQSQCPLSFPSIFPLTGVYPILCAQYMFILVSAKLNCHFFPSPQTSSSFVNKILSNNFFDQD